MNPRACQNHPNKGSPLLVDRGKPADVRSLLSFGAGRDVKLYRLTFAESLETLALDCGEMDENVLPVLRGDESVPLLVTEPLNCSFCHRKLDNLPFFNVLKETYKNTKATPA